MLTSTEKAVLGRYLVYHPENKAFEEVVQMIRRDSLNIRVKPEYVGMQGSLGDLVTISAKEQQLNNNLQ